MALPLIPSMLLLGFGIPILLTLLIFLNSFFVRFEPNDAGGSGSTSGGGNGRPSTSGGGNGRPSTSGGGGRRSELHRAARRGNLERLQSELAGLSEAKRRKMLKSRDASKQTPLSLAARNNRVNVVAYLVGEMERLQVAIFSDDMKDMDPEKSHPIHRACIEGYLDVVKILCRHCVELKLAPQLSMFSPNYHGQTILHLAAENHRVDIFKYLLTLPGCQVQIDAQDKNGRTPRDLAQLHGDLAQLLRQADTVAP